MVSMNWTMLLAQSMKKQVATQCHCAGSVYTWRRRSGRPAGQLKMGTIHTAYWWTDTAALSRRVGPGTHTGQ